MWGSHFDGNRAFNWMKEACLIMVQCLFPYKQLERHNLGDLGGGELWTLWVPWGAKDLGRVDV